eukprot:1421159-Rhodomonas_salina.1
MPGTLRSVVVGPGRGGAGGEQESESGVDAAQGGETVLCISRNQPKAAPDQPNSAQTGLQQPNSAAKEPVTTLKQPNSTAKALKTAPETG